MLKNYLKIALRNLIKNKGYSFINIMGLAIGIACCLLILLFIQDELSYDRFHEKSDRMYRITLNGKLGDNEFHVATTSPPLGKTLVEEYPEVEAATRINSFGFPVLRYNDNVFSEEKFYWVDSTFSQVFTVEFIKGDAFTALTEPHSVVLTEKMAEKYFGNEDPMGKLLNSDNRRDYKVTGVVKEFPQNSHWHFDFLASMSSYPFTAEPNWLNNNFITYIVLKKDFPPEQFADKLPDVVQKYVAPYVQQVMGVSMEFLRDKGAKYEYGLQPLTDIHLYSALEGELGPNSDITYIYIFAFIAAGLLLIACINFTNLATARSANRAREIGVRKTLGSNKAQLIKQFLSESLLMTFLAVIAALILIELALPSFNNLIEKQLSADYLNNYYSIPILILFILFVGLLAGGYPALYLSAFNPVKVLRKQVGKNSGKVWLRNALVVTQFAISIILFIGTIIVYNQLDFIQNKKLGFNKEQVIVVQKADDIGRFMQSFKEELKNIPGVLSVSNSNTLFGKEMGNNPYKVYGSNENKLFTVLFADDKFADTYQIEMAEGRYYSNDVFPADTLAIVMNEAAVKEFGFDDPLGKKVTFMHGENDTNVPVFRVIGVMKDFNYQSLHQNIKPLIIRNYFPENFGRLVSVRVTPGDYEEKIKAIEAAWHKYAGNQAFEYFFFDEDFAKLYKAEQRTGVLVTVFALLAIFIACLGLLGLAAFTTEQRTKEVGIRKILGASIGGIVLLLSKDFIKWIIIANLIAWPAAYFIMNRWLEDFAYRINISIWVFIIAGAAAILIAYATVSYQALKAAVANPVNSLKYE
jgi:putative ABC transport system permease protein